MADSPQVVIEANSASLLPPVNTLIIKGSGFSSTVSENHLEFVAPVEGTTPPNAFRIVASSPTQLEVEFDPAKLKALQGYVGPLIARVTVGEDASDATQVAMVDPFGPMAWSYLNLPCPLQARKAPTMAALDGQLYIFGGESDEGANNDLFVLDMDLLQFRILAVQEKKPAPRSHHSACFLGRRMYVYGGLDNGNIDPKTKTTQQYGDLWAYDVDEDKWHEVETSGPSPEVRDSHVSFVMDGLMYIFGGIRLSPWELATGLYRLDPKEAKWELLCQSDRMPLCRYPAVKRVGEDECWMVGGFPSHENRPGGRWGRVYRFNKEDLHHNPWIHVEDIGGPTPSDRDSHPCGLLHGKVIFCSGWDQEKSNVETFDLDTSAKTFGSLANCPTTRVAPAAFSLANYWYNYGGFRFDKDGSKCHYEILNDVVKIGYPGVARGLQPPRVTHTGRHDMTVEWDLPIDCNCSQVEAYELFFRPDAGGQDWQLCSTNPDRHHNQQNLKPWTRYCWRYRARNSVGWSAFSPECVDRTAAGPPDPPLIELLGSVLCVHISMEPTADNGRPVKTFELQCWDEHQWITLHTGSAKEFLHDKADPHVQQKYRARCSNELGWSDWTEEACGRSKPDRPSAPTIWSDKLELTSNQMVLRWTLSSDGGSEVEEYALECMTDSTVKYSGLETFHKEAGLPPATRRLWRVRARTSAGWGDWSPACVETTLPARPEAPEPYATAPDSRKLRARWAPVEDNGSHVTEYTVEFSGDLGATWEVVAKDELFEFVRPVKPATKGMFRCTATNAVGTSDYGSATGTTPADVPDAVPAPRVDDNTITAHSMKVLWSEPECNGSPITQYRLEQREEGSKDWTVVYEDPERSHDAVGLKHKTTYEYRVSALNDMGWGERSELCQGTTCADKPSVPKAPWIEKDSITAVAMSVHWEEPQNNGAEITCYRLEQRLHSADGEWQQIYEGPSLEVLAKPLTPETCYCFRVCACNSAGWSPWSSECADTTKPWEVDFGLSADSVPEDELPILGSFSSNDQDSDASCTVRLQVSGDKQSWEDLASAQGTSMNHVFQDINRYFRLVVEHPSGLTRTGGHLHLRLQPVVDGAKVPKAVDAVRSMVSAAQEDTVEVNLQSPRPRQPDPEESPMRTSAREASESSEEQLQLAADTPLKQRVQKVENSLAQVQAALEHVQAALELSKIQVSMLNEAEAE